MKKILLSEAEYRDKVYACWLGKNIGGTLGAPFEGRKYVNDLDFYPVIPEGAAPNDDLDFQLVWLKMLEEKGVEVTLPNLADYWLKHLSAYPWNEYGFCHRNLELGLRPPVSGCFENYYVDEMGSPIRSEIWACIAPGDPQLAAAMAWKDSALDHAGGEGTYGEMFWAAAESAAFVTSDPMTLIQVGLQMIPVWSRISRAIREATWCYENGVRWAEARDRVVTYYGHHQPCHAVHNHAFTVLGWLYGRDFGDKLCKAVNCGYDTDCTGATLGAMLGIIGGTGGIPERWRAPIGERIALHRFTRLPGAPRTIGELTQRTMAVAQRMMQRKSDVVGFAAERRLADDALSLLFRNEKALAALRQDVHASVGMDGDLEMWLHYNGEPVLHPGIGKTIGVSLQRADAPVEAEVTLEPPSNWEVQAMPDAFGQKRFLVTAANVADRNTLTVNIPHPEPERHASFLLLGPGGARGHPSGRNVPTCPVCSGYEGSCVCR